MDGAASDNFGVSVSLSDDGKTALIGAYYATVGANAYQGAAYVFANSGGTWGEQQKLTSSDGAADDGFGGAVSLSGDGNTALIGAEGAGLKIQGAAYVFVNSGVTWTQQQKLTASDGAANNYFGWAVSLSGDGNTALIGTNEPKTAQGAAYEFVRNGVAWNEQQKLTASDGAANDVFGISASLSSDGDTILIGSYNAKVDGHASQGAAYVFATVSAITYSISGTVTSGGSGLLGATMNLGGAATQSTTTDSSGNYIFSGLSKGVYKITPSLTGYTFTPQILSSNVNGAALTGRNFAAATVPGAPTGVNAIPGNALATVSFTGPSSSGGSNITSYTVTPYTGGTAGKTTSGPHSPIIVKGLTNGTSYTFTVTAKNKLGTGPASTASSPVIPVTVPRAPTQVIATPGNALATVNFTPTPAVPVSDGGSPVISYIVTPYIGRAAQQIATGTGSPIIVPGLSNGTAYTFTVEATNSFGTGLPTKAVKATPATFPDAPTGVTAAPGKAQATISFTPTPAVPASDGGYPVTSYMVTPYDNGTPTGKTTSGSHSPIIVKGLTGGHSYTFTVTAKNKVGADSGSVSAASSSITITAQ